MVRHGRYAILVGAITLFSGISFGQGESSALRPPERIEGPAVANRISILSYNIKGMPWPVAWGRDEAMERIADRLAAYRQRGEQPRIVLLQEAFTERAREIGARAGYRHIAFGPGAGQDAAETGAPPLGHDWTRGEAIGKPLGSGLAILSDFPILAVESIAYGDSACAGFDCLANKGAMMALIRVPGMRDPVRIFNTHLNARTASGVPVARANIAFGRQLGLFARFIRDKTAPSAAIIIGGDFNIGQDEMREAAFSALSATGRLPGFISLGNASTTRLVRSNAVREPEQRADMRAIVERRKDLMFASPSLRPLTASVPFGTEPVGGPLSDHFGYRIDYAFAPAKGGQAPRIAAGTRSGALPGDRGI